MAIGRVAALVAAALLLAGCRQEPQNFDPSDPVVLELSQIAACEAIDYSDPDQGRLTFSDEFEGTELDRDRWRVRDDTILDFDQALLRRENVSVHDGLLDIAGKRLPEDQWERTEESRFEWNQLRQYSSGYVDSIRSGGYGNEPSDERFSQRYGHFEIRAKLPSRSTMSRGIWPAFWLRADDTDGEIDVMESYGAPTTRDFDPSAGYYWNSWEESAQTYSRDHLQGEASLPPGTRVWEDFHTYGVNWSPECLRYTFDGRTVGIVPLGARDYLTGDTFDDAFHLRLNMQVGSSYWGAADPEHTRPEFHFLVDWVRVHQGNDFDS